MNTRGASRAGARIHETAVVETSDIAAGVEIGPYCYIGPGVSIGERTVVMAHVTILGPTRLGRNNRIFPHVCLGAAPQDRSYAGEPTDLVIGDDNAFREQVTAHRGTRKGGGSTTIGSANLFMVGCHVAHDCHVGSRVTFANYTSLGGHVSIDDGVVCGGHVAIAPFVRVGRLSFLAGGSMVERDVPPFVIAEGNRARVRAINRVGLRRAGIPRSARLPLERAVRIIFGSSTLRADALALARAEYGKDPYVRELLQALA